MLTPVLQVANVMVVQESMRLAARHIASCTTVGGCLASTGAAHRPPDLDGMVTGWMSLHLHFSHRMGWQATDGYMWQFVWYISLWRVGVVCSGLETHYRVSLCYLVHCLRSATTPSPQQHHPSDSLLSLGEYPIRQLGAIDRTRVQ